MIDFHAHISAKPKPIPKRYADSVRSYMGMDVTHYATAEELVEELQKNSVERACILPVASVSPQRTAKMNDLTRATTINHPILEGFASVNPNSPDAEEEVDRALKENGLRGLVVDPKQEFNFNGSNFWRVLEAAKKHASAVFVHREYMSADEFFDVDSINDTVTCFPRLKFVFPLYESKGILPEPNVYLWTAHARADEIERALERFGPEKMLFGSDFRYNFYPSYEIATIMELSIGEAEKEMILGGNAAKILGKPNARKENGKSILDGFPFLKELSRRLSGEAKKPSPNDETKAPR